MANTNAIRQQAAHTTYQLLAAQQEPYKKSLTFNKTTKLRIFFKKSQENGPLVLEK